MMAPARNDHGAPGVAPADGRIARGRWPEVPRRRRIGDVIARVLGPVTAYAELRVPRARP
jgi:hypothetical protein